MHFTLRSPALGWLAGVGLALTTAPAVAAGNCDPTSAVCSSATATTAADDNLDWIYFFGDTQHLQTTSDQVSLATQTGPLPFTVSGNVQVWTSGPPLGNLYTESAQTSLKLNPTWTLLGQQLYQQQGSITLTDLVGGVNYKPSPDLSINLLMGGGVHTLYTYQWSTFLFPQYRLPWKLGGEQRVAFETDGTFEHYELGNFSQATPKLDLRIAPWFPQLQVGYAFGNFDNTTAVSVTQYYQPQAIRGTTVTAVIHPLENIYVVMSFLPNNKNYIAGSFTDQTTFGGTLHWNLSNALRLSFYGEDTWYENGSDRALGGGLSFAF